MVYTWNSPGQNTGVGSLSFLQGIVTTQGSNPGFPHCRQSLYQLSYQGSPQCRRPGFDPWVGKTPGGGHGNPFQCSCPENPVDRGAWWAAVQGVAKSRTRLSDKAHTLDSSGIINKRKDVIFHLKELKV